MRCGWYAEPLMTLEEMRKRRGCTMQEVADALGVVRQTYSALEADPSAMTFRQAATVCRLLRCDVVDISDFFPGDEREGGVA